MGTAPTILVIALSANEIHTPRATTIFNTAREVLGQEVTLQVEVREPEARDSDAILETSPPSGYAWISWDSANSTLAHLHCFVPATRRWVHRDVAFAPQDPPLETGRTLGFVIASIYLGNDGAPAERPAPVPRKTKESMPAAPLRHFIVQGAASVAAPRDVTSAGGWLSADWQVTRQLSLGSAGEARFGTVDNTQSSSRFIAFGLLGTYRAWPARGAVWLGPQVFFGAEQLVFRHFSDDDDRPVAETSWQLRLDALLLANWEFTDSSFVFTGIGTNYRFGTTDVIVRGAERAHIPAWVGLARLGFGTRF